MYSDNKQIRDVADVAAKIMYGQQPVTEKLHPNQQQLDVHEPEKDELTADDFKKLRAKKEVKKEEVEELDEDKYDRMLSSMLKGKSGERLLKKHSDEVKKSKDIESGKTLNKLVKKNPGVLKTYSDAVKRDKKIYGEEVEAIDEVKMADLPSTKVQGRSYGASKPEPHAVDTLSGPKDKELKDIEAEKKKKQKKFSEMVNLYQEKGLKSLSEMLVKEEPDNEQFTKELEDAKEKSEGKKKNTEIAKGSVQAVKQEETEQAEAESLIENFEMINEVSLGAKIKAYASHSSDAFEHGDMGNDEESEHHSARAEKIHAHILKHHGTEAANHADKAANSAIFGNGKYKGSDSLSGGLRGQHSKSVTKFGKIPKNTQSAMKNSAKGSYGKRIVGPKGHLPEEVELGEDNMNSAEMEKREKIVKGMKKGMAGFKERYGSRANDVMYAAATKQAMK